MQSDDDSGPPACDADEASRVGLCSACQWARSRANARGSRFWQCGRAELDARFARYPRLPVQACPGFTRGAPPPRDTGA